MVENTNISGVGHFGEYIGAKKAPDKPFDTEYTNFHNFVHQAYDPSLEIIWSQDKVKYFYAYLDLLGPQKRPKRSQNAIFCFGIENMVGFTSSRGVITGLWPRSCLFCMFSSNFIPLNPES